MITQNPIFGVSRKKFSNAIAYRLYGKNILRSKPITYRDANVQSQKEQRSKAKLIMRALSAVLTSVRWGLRGYTQNMSAFSYAIKLNLPEAVSGTYPNYIIDLDKFMPSDGLKPQPELVLNFISTPGSVEISWEDDPMQSHIESDDTLNVIVISADQSQIYCVNELMERSDPTKTFSLPAWYSHSTDFLLFFETRNSHKPSGAGIELAGKPKKY